MTCTDDDVARRIVKALLQLSDRTCVAQSALRLAEARHILREAKQRFDACLSGVLNWRQVTHVCRFRSRPYALTLVLRVIGMDHLLPIWQHRMSQADPVLKLLLLEGVRGVTRNSQSPRSASYLTTRSYSNSDKHIPDHCGLSCFFTT